MSDSIPRGALSGVTVLDMSRILAGPFCTQMLSDLGAVVWKVEPPWGDETRRWGPPFLDGESAYYLSANRGKRSLAINLKDTWGQDLVRRLAERADILVENYRPGALARYGLDYGSMSRANPRLVYASITGFGHTGPRAGEPGVDSVLQALTGIMSVTGEPAGPPVRVGVAWIDLLTGLTAVTGILAALRQRDRTGAGEHLDLSLFDVGLMSMVNVAQSYLVTGESPIRLGSAHAQVVPYQAFQVSDGWLMVTVVSDRQFQQLCRATERLDLWADTRYRTNSGRIRHRDELVPELVEVFRDRAQREWLDALEKYDVPAAPVYSLAEALDDPQAADRRAVWPVQHPTLGELPVMASALQHMTGTRVAAKGPPPLLGEHTREVLTEVLGLSPSDVDGLERRGVVVCGPTGKD